MSFRRVINYHRIIEFSWLSEPPLPRAPHFRRRRGKFQAGLVAIKRKNGIDRLRFALVRPRQIRVIIYLTSPVHYFLTFNQFSFTSDGCQIVYNLIRHTLAEHPDWVVLSGDESSAFQRALRPEMRWQLSKKFPELVNYFSDGLGPTSAQGLYEVVTRLGNWGEG